VGRFPLAWNLDIVAQPPRELGLGTEFARSAKTVERSGEPSPVGK